MATMTRKQLYDLIWSKPMRDAAREIGLSDVGLKKACVRHQVPVPPQGYWNRIHAGQSPQRLPFLEIDEPALNRIAISATGFQVAPEVKKALDAAKAREKQPEQRIEVSSAPASLPAAVELAAALKSGKPGERGLVSAIGPKLFLTQVTPASVDRAVSLAEALLVAAAARGFAVRPGERHLMVVIEDDAAVISLKETVKHVLHVRTPEEIEHDSRREAALRGKRWNTYASLYREEERWDDLATGQLFFEIEGKEHLGVRTRWSDTKTRRLETMLNDVLAGLVAWAAARRQRREKHEQWQREWKLKEERAAEARRRAELEKARRTFLDQRLQLFDELHRLDRYLGRLKGTAHWQQAPGSLSDFLHWAEHRVEQLRRECSPERLQELVAESTLFSGKPDLYAWQTLDRSSWS